MLQIILLNDFFCEVFGWIFYIVSHLKKHVLVCLI